MRSHIFGGSMIVAGTAIGAGMLALPVATAAGGFFPSILIYLLCYVFMLVTGLFVAELCLKSTKETNLISIASNYMGKWGRYVTWALYLFLFYTLTVAYITAGGLLVSQVTGFSQILSMTFFTLALGLVVFLGTAIVDRCNLFLIAGLVISYIAFLFYSWSHIEPTRLLHIAWPKAFLALPVIFTSFSYQGTVPSLVTYLQRDPKKIRWAIIIGTSVVFVFYLLFQFFILGSIPLEGLLQAKDEGNTAISPLAMLSGREGAYLFGQFFSFFAVTTSFLGVTLGLFDFFSDGLQLRKRGKTKFLIAFCTFIPPLCISLVYPGIFLVALGYAGGIGCALLLGLLPTLWIWSSRFIRKEAGKKIISGGRLFLLFLFAFVLFELGIEVIGEILRLTS